MWAPIFKAKEDTLWKSTEECRGHKYNVQHCRNSPCLSFGTKGCSYWATQDEQKVLREGFRVLKLTSWPHAWDSCLSSQILQHYSAWMLFLKYPSFLLDFQWKKVLHAHKQSYIPMWTAEDTTSENYFSVSYVELS